MPGSRAPRAASSVDVVPAAPQRAPGKETAVQRAMAAPLPPQDAATAPAAPAARGASPAQRAGDWDAGPELLAAMGMSPEPHAATERAPVQRMRAHAAAPDTAHAAPGSAHAAAQRGTAGPGGALPFADPIQRSFGAHDLGAVRAHTDGAAAAACGDLGASAFATGQDVAFAAAPDLHTAAHEAAHVVQQRQGVQLKGGIGQAHDPYEQHANAVADLVVQGRSAQPLLDAIPGAAVVGAGPAVQRFGSAEHQSLGNNAAASASYDLAQHGTPIDATEYGKAFELSHGDLVMLTGDYFSPSDTRPTAAGGTEPNPDSLFLLAAIPSRSPGQCVGTYDEVVYAIKHAVPQDPRFSAKPSPRWPAGHPWSRVIFSASVMDVVAARYLRLAGKNDAHFAAPRGAASQLDPTDGSSAGASYRAQHEAALQLAYAKGAPDPARAREAAAHHFLTDHFAAGHLRTPRDSIRSHWRAIYPNFWINFRNKIALDVAIWINAHDRVGNLATVDMIYQGVQKTVVEKTASLPAIGFDDVVSLVAHDYDNEHGLWVENDVGDHWKLYGDGNLDKDATSGPKAVSRTQGLAQEAIAMGLADIDAAARLGANKSAEHLPKEQLFEKVRASTGGRAHPDPVKYGAEQLLPRQDAAKASFSGTQNWKKSSLEELWNTPVHSSTADTFGTEIEKALKHQGDLNKELTGMADKFPESQNASGFEVHPRRGFLEGFVDPLAVNARSGMTDLVHFSPSRGHSGHTKDDAVLREVSDPQGKGTPAPTKELQGMTLEQRVERVRVLIEGYCSEEEGEAVLRLFETAPKGQQRTLYERVEGHPWTGQLRDGIFTRDDDLVDALTDYQLGRLQGLLGG